MPSSLQLFLPLLLLLLLDGPPTVGLSLAAVAPQPQPGSDTSTATDNDVSAPSVSSVHRNLYRTPQDLGDGQMGRFKVSFTQTLNSGDEVRVRGTLVANPAR